MREQVKVSARADTFRVIDPTCGRVHSENASEREARSDAVIIAGCRGACLIISNGQVPEDVEPRIQAILQLSQQQVTPCQCVS
jgi:hypothetical protein